MYVSNGAVPAFAFYAPVYGLAGADYISNVRDDYQNPVNISRQLEFPKRKIAGLDFAVPCIRKGGL